MTLKIIGAGFGRTGTTSLQTALQQLGYQKCYHMVEVFKNPAHVKLWGQAWHDISEDRRPEWSEIFNNYQATVDWPACTHYKELMEAYPDAKVLLSIRDPERWYESVRDTIYQIPRSRLTYLIKIFLPHMRQLHASLDKSVWSGTFNDRFEDRDYAIGVFNDHIAAVKAHVPPEKLLVYNVKEGWEPLCHFLEVDVPTDQPFPHLNDKVQMQRAMRWGPAVIILTVIVILAGLLALLFGLLNSFG